jgi:hypothetical protein
MKTMGLLILVALSSACIAEEPASDCGKQFEVLMRRATSATQTASGSPLNQIHAKLSSRCVELHKCEHIDELLSMKEVVLDAEINKAEREKLAMLKSYIEANREHLINKELCGVIAGFDPVLEKLQSLDRDELERFNLLVSQRVRKLLALVGPEEANKLGVTLPASP